MKCEREAAMVPDLSTTTQVGCNDVNSMLENFRQGSQTFQINLHSGLLRYIFSNQGPLEGQILICIQGNKYQQ